MCRLCLPVMRSLNLTMCRVMHFSLSALSIYLFLSLSVTQRPPSSGVHGHRWDESAYALTRWRCTSSPGGKASPVCPARGAALWAWPATTATSATTHWGSLRGNRKAATGLPCASTCARKSSMPAKWRWGWWRCWGWWLWRSERRIHILLAGFDGCFWK